MRITTHHELRTLADDGLYIPHHNVDKHIANNPRDVQSATYDLLWEWRNSQINSRIAFQNLWQAVDRCNMNNLLLDILQPDSVSVESRVRDVEPRQMVDLMKQSGMFKFRKLFLTIISLFIATYRNLYYHYYIINITALY